MVSRVTDPFGIEVEDPVASAQGGTAPVYRARAPEAKSMVDTAAVGQALAGWLERSNQNLQASAKLQGELDAFTGNENNPETAPGNASRWLLGESYQAGIARQRIPKEAAKLQKEAAEGWPEAAARGVTAEQYATQLQGKLKQAVSATMPGMAPEDYQGMFSTLAQTEAAINTGYVKYKTAYDTQQQVAVTQSTAATSLRNLEMYSHPLNTGKYQQAVGDALTGVLGTYKGLNRDEVQNGIEAVAVNAVKLSGKNGAAGVLSSRATVNAVLSSEAFKFLDSDAQSRVMGKLETARAELAASHVAGALITLDDTLTKVHMGGSANMSEVRQLVQTSEGLHAQQVISTPDLQRIMAKAGDIQEAQYREAERRRKEAESSTLGVTTTATDARKLSEKMVDARVAQHGNAYLAKGEVGLQLIWNATGTSNPNETAQGQKMWKEVAEQFFTGARPVEKSGIEAAAKGDILFVQAMQQAYRSRNEPGSTWATMADSNALPQQYREYLASAFDTFGSGQVDAQLVGTIRDGFQKFVASQDERIAPAIRDAAYRVGSDVLDQGFWNTLKKHAMVHDSAESNVRAFFNRRANTLLSLGKDSSSEFDKVRAEAGIALDSVFRTYSQQALVQSGVHLSKEYSENPKRGAEVVQSRVADAIGRYAFNVPEVLTIAAVPVATPGSLLSEHTRGGATSEVLQNIVRDRIAADFKARGNTEKYTSLQLKDLGNGAIEILVQPRGSSSAVALPPNVGRITRPDIREADKAASAKALGDDSHLVSSSLILPGNHPVKLSGANTDGVMGSALLNAQRYGMALRPPSGTVPTAAANQLAVSKIPEVDAGFAVLGARRKGDLTGDSKLPVLDPTLEGPTFAVLGAAELATPGGARRLAGIIKQARADQQAGTLDLQTTYNSISQMFPQAQSQKDVAEYMRAVARVIQQKPVLY